MIRKKQKIYSFQYFIHVRVSFLIFKYKNDYTNGIKAYQITRRSVDKFQYRRIKELRN